MCQILVIIGIWGYDCFGIFCGLFILEFKLIIQGLDIKYLVCGYFSVEGVFRFGNINQFGLVIEGIMLSGYEDGFYVESLYSQVYIWLVELRLWCV